MTHTKDEALISLITELVGIVALYDMEKARRLGKRVHLALAAPVQPIGYEKYTAIREGHRNASEETYFAARPDLPLTTAMLKLFRDGFDRGYDTTPPAQPAPAPIKPIVDPGLDVNQRLAFKLGWKSAEETHGITEKGQP